MNKLNRYKYAMTYQEIAEELTRETGEVYTSNQIKMICLKALKKLRLNDSIEILREYI